MKGYWPRKMTTDIFEKYNGFICLKVDEACRLLVCDRARLRSLVKSGILKARGYGPGRRITVESIEKANIPKQMEFPYED